MGKVQYLANLKKHAAQVFSEKGDEETSFQYC
ncbi:predicted protein [Sclerotinia sclerotiorum 1980 UF-70]|uniref:Uncharacterized protein n=1 Tax=Sclerotinia sclerotiorum (strain ATCC 18683 / 1980 / Ss-1) TaxID=665079 RepID=A7ET07_SCLS1|nr:predicted protein [Sclerotinia sclerotiorum 1980 UF-70]EDN92599.1 predicted protein [Sclerotinia sclerotiorum 1980 UF-70]